MRKLQKTEVRIGNYFIFVDSFDCRENDDINQISESDFDDSDFMWDRKLPLDITEDILVKLGFGKNECYFTHKSKHIVEYDSDKQCFMFYFFEIGDWYNIIKYVHELQNLYFAICGEELVFSTEP